MPNLKPKLLSILIPILFVGFFMVIFEIPLVQAGGATVPPTIQLTNPIGANDIQTIIGRIIRAFLGIMGSIALLMFVYGGFLWLTSAGKSEKIKKGKDTLIWASIGLAFILSSYIVASFVINVLTSSGT